VKAAPRLPCTEAKYSSSATTSLPAGPPHGARHQLDADGAAPRDRVVRRQLRVLGEVVAEPAVAVAAHRDGVDQAVLAQEAQQPPALGGRPAPGGRVDLALRLGVEAELPLERVREGQVERAQLAEVHAVDDVPEAALAAGEQRRLQPRPLPVAEHGARAGEAADVDEQDLGERPPRQ
jgi:hypothetical protein